MIGRSASASRRRALGIGVGAALVVGGAMAIGIGAGGSAPPRVADAEAARRGLEEAYGVVVRFEDPRRFVTAPFDAPPSTIAATAMEPAQVPVALALVERALAIYPRGFVRATLGGVFLCASVRTFGREAGGLVFLSGIYLPGRALDQAAEARRQFVLTLHHELSSLTLARGGFPKTEWERILPGGFRYPDGRAAELESLNVIDDPAALERAQARGFVNSYGETSLENDVNTFAEIAFGDPAELARLSRAHPAIRAKLGLFLAFHESLDPGFAPLFATSGLRAAASQKTGG